MNEVTIVPQYNGNRLLCAYCMKMVSYKSTHVVLTRDELKVQPYNPPWSVLQDLVNIKPSDRVYLNTTLMVDQLRAVTQVGGTAVCSLHVFDAMEDQSWR